MNVLHHARTGSPIDDQGLFASLIRSFIRFVRATTFLRNSKIFSPTIILSLSFAASLRTSGQALPTATCTAWVGDAQTPNAETVPCMLTIVDINHLSISPTVGNAATLTRTSATPSDFTLTGQWASSNIQCPPGTFNSETFQIVQSVDSYVATKIKGDVCVTSGHVSFFGSIIPPPVSITLIDPVPDLVYGARITTALTESDAALGQPFLADLSKGRQVTAVATDGVAQILIRIPASYVGETFSLMLRPDQCAALPSDGLPEDACISNYGLIFDPANPLYDPIHPPPDAAGTSAITVVSVSTTDGPMAFAAYRAPNDFVRAGQMNRLDSAAAERSVVVTVTTAQGQALPDLTISLLRPPIAFIHGLASDPQTWDYFSPLVSDRSAIHCFVDYRSTNIARLRVNAPIVNRELNQCLASFRQTYGVAAVQADAVVHSMGGLLVRASSNLPNFANNNNFIAGSVHKLITIGTPHTGTPFANTLQRLPSLCRTIAYPDILINALFPLARFAVNNRESFGAFADLAIGSRAISEISLANPRRAFPLIRAHVIVGVASSEQDINNAATVRRLFIATCPRAAHLLDHGFHSFYDGPSDTIVPDASEQAIGLGYDDPDIFGTYANRTDDNLKAVTRIPDVIHAVFPFAFPFGPDELARNLDSKDELIGVDSLTPKSVTDLLNTSILSDTFAPIVP